MNPEILLRKAVNKEFAKAIQPEPDTFETDTKKLLSRLKELELQQKMNTRLLNDFLEKTERANKYFKRLIKAFADIAKEFE